MIQIFSTVLAVFLSAHAAQDAQAAPAPAPAPPSQGVRVVELFTSQGCPMCPGANELLEAMAEADPDVLALAFGVNYWDVYGWRDTFAMDSFNARQQAYVDAGEARRVYTPQFVVNGAPDKLRYGEATVRTAVGQAPALSAPISAQRRAGRIAVAFDGPPQPAPAVVWAIAYHEGPEVRRVDAGPNAGRDVRHYNMVRSVEHVADWSGGALSLALDAPGEGLAAAIIVQAGPGGRILAAARVE